MCAAIVATSPVNAQDPVGGALATLAAATAQAQRVRAAQQATAAAISAEAARAANIAQATVRAQSALATQGALDELNRQRAAAATAQALNFAATATAQSLSLAATSSAQQAAATAQAGQVAGQATAQAVTLERDTQLARTYATRQERFTWGLLLVEIAGGLGAFWILFQVVKTLTAWAVRMRPAPLVENVPVGFVTSPTPAQSARVVIDQEPSRPGRMPETVRVVDDPRMVEALGTWAEQYDAQQGGNGGSKH
jgi:hypothetical protein